MAVSLLFDNGGHRALRLGVLVPEPFAAFVFRVVQDMSSDLLPETLVIIGARKLIGESLRAVFTTANVFSRVRVADNFSAKIDGPATFLVVAHSYLQTRQTLQQIQTAQPDATIVILDEQFRSGGGILTCDAIVHGYWTFQDSAQEILNGIVRARHRCASISPYAINDLRHSRRKGVQIGLNLLDHPLYKLSKRERQLFFLIAGGKKIETCAAEMNIAKKTACNLREKLMKKFGVQSGTELVWKTIEAGFVDLVGSPKRPK
ncbi:MAG: LuxR C-terminal-related transcriptional regulator [Planctomycetaceae bacterium]|nr:LuxR C-terminal-related transcriptional regulator [Planctomycetaceae bacterium]